MGVVKTKDGERYEPSTRDGDCPRCGTRSLQRTYAVNRSGTKTHYIICTNRGCRFEEIDS